MTITRTDNFDDFEKKVKRKALQFINAATSVGAASAKFYAPVAYSVLVNSQKVDVSESLKGIRGTVGFYVDYAKYLEGDENHTPNWKPKRPPKYGSKNGRSPAMAWNAQARPGFLKYGFENNSTQSQIDELRSIFKF